jgi:Uma2 family endonuclease
MTVTVPVRRIAIEDYLAGEERSDVRHEYVDGDVYAMVGSTAAYNLIAGGLYATLTAHLAGSPCRALLSDMKVRIERAFYYPDVVVSCAPVRPTDVYLSEPVVVVEVLSESTEGRDRFEKRIAHQSLPSLREYVLIAPLQIQVQVYRRTGEGWEHETCTCGDTLRLAALDFTTPVDSLYRSVLDLPT